jgi:hypothetical protein
MLYVFVDRFDCFLRVQQRVVQGSPGRGVVLHVMNLGGALAWTLNLQP